MAGTGFAIEQRPVMSEFSDFEEDDKFGVDYDFNISDLTGLDGKYSCKSFIY